MDPRTKTYIDNSIRDHVHNGLQAQRVNSFDVFDHNRYILYRIVASGTAVTTGTGVGGDFVMPFTGQITDVGVTADTAGTTGTMDIDINNGGSSIFTTVITVDSTEKTSRTAATPFVFATTTPSFTEGDIFTFDVDAVQTTAASGLTVFMNVINTEG